jgi:condensin complex subunit 1
MLIMNRSSLTSGPGSLLDKTLRIEMENQIFRKLQEAVEHPCRSREWFGLAEQVVNTVYALGEHPDIFCNELIKKLSVRAFARRQRAAPDLQDKETGPGEDPDAMNEDEPEVPSQMENSKDSTQNSPSPADKDLGDAFELSQLLFVVGHVAIKHIVFLELVERELKRQKDERRAGKSLFTVEFHILTFIVS